MRGTRFIVPVSRSANARFLAATKARSSARCSRPMAAAS
jgi:hypothetical protein